jgi:hypothetical protein
VTEKLVAATFGPLPFSLEGIAHLFLALGDIENDDLRPLAAKLGVSEDSFHIKAVADILGLSNEPRELPELYSAVRRLLRAEAPVTIVFEEVGAAGPAFFNLLSYLEQALENEDVIIELRGEPDDPYPLVGSGADLMRAGMHSLRRSDMPAADAFLTAAAEALPPGADRSACLAARCDALLAGGRAEQALQVARAGLRDATERNDERYRARFTFFTTILGEGTDDFARDMKAIASVLLAHGDLAGAAQAEEAMAHHRWDEGERADSMELMRVALDHARSAQDRQTATRMVAWLCDALADAPDPAQARADIEALGWVASFSPLVEVKRLTSLAVVEARAGSVATARSLIEVARALADDLGQPPTVSGFPEAAKEIERLAAAEQAGLAKDV